MACIESALPLSDNPISSKDLLLQLYLTEQESNSTETEDEATQRYATIREYPTQQQQRPGADLDAGLEDTPAAPADKESALGTSATASQPSARSQATLGESLAEELQSWSALPTLRCRVADRLRSIAGETAPPDAAMSSALDASKLKLLSNNYPDIEKGDDSESIMTEDFVNKFNEMFVPKEDSGISSVPSQSRLGSGSTRRTRPYDDGGFKADVIRSAEPGLRPSTRSPAYKPFSGREGQDGDSTATDDFESNFRHLLFRGSGPGAREDSVVESSEAATARSNRLRERVGNLFHVPATRVKLNDDSHSDTETDYVDKKFHEIMERRKRESSSLTRSHSIPASPKLSNLRAASASPAVAPFRATSPAVAPFRATSPDRAKPLLSQRDAKPRPRPGTPKAQDDGLQDEEYRAEIRLNSLRIKRELEQERRERLPSPKREPPEPPRKLAVGLTPRETLDRKMVELDAMTDNVKRARGEREALMSDLRDMQDTLRKNAAEVRFTERWMRENRAKAEDVRTELMMAEMKRDTTLKEVNRLNDECGRKRGEILDLEDKLRQRVREIQEFESQGINRDELEAVIAERNELLQIIRANEESEYQKYELEKQLSIAKEDLMSEQQKNREKHIILEEELEASMAKITDLRREKESLKSDNLTLTERLNRVERELKSSEQEKGRLRTEYEELGKSIRSKNYRSTSFVLNDVIQTKAEEFERIRGRMEADLEEVRQRQTREESALQRDVRGLHEANTRLQREAEAATQAADEFRRQVAQLTQDLAAASDSRGHLLEEAERRIRELEAEKDAEVRQAVEQAVAEEADRAAEARAQADQERHLAAQFHHELEELRTQVKLREDEADYLKDRLRRQEVETKRVGEEAQTEARARVREALARERQAWEKAEEQRWRRQVASLREDAQHSLQEVEGKAARQREAIHSLENTVAELRKALEEEQVRTKTITRERQAAIARAKELADEEKAREVEKLRERLQRETETELGRLRVQVQTHSEHLASVRRDKEAQLAHEEELRGIAERIERTVVSEVNEECRKMADVLGIKPRSINVADFAGSESGSKSSNPVTAALANMEACGEEMRSLVLELRASNEEIRTQLTALAKERDAELEQVRRQLQTEKTKEVVLRGHRIRVEHATEVSRLENLLREKEEEVRNVKRGMQKWKTETAEQIATNIQTEFNRVGQRKIKDLQASLLERERDIQRLQADMSKAAAMGRSTPDPNAARLIGHLQDQVKQLRKENLLLHKKGLSRHTGSTGDLSNGHLAESGSPPRPGSRNSLSRKIVSHV